MAARRGMRCGRAEELAPLGRWDPSDQLRTVLRKAGGLLGV